MKENKGGKHEVLTGLSHQFSSAEARLFSHWHSLYHLGRNTLKGSGWQWVYCNTVTHTLLFLWPVCACFKSLTASLARCFRYFYSNRIFKVSLDSITVCAGRSIPPPHCPHNHQRKCFIKQKSNSVASLARSHRWRERGTAAAN